MQSLLKNTAAYKLLKAEKEKDRFGHAYLLTMDDGRNLRFAAKTFAKLFFGCETTATPEQKRIAKLIDEDNFSEVIESAPRSHDIAMPPPGREAVEQATQNAPGI